MTAAPAFHEPDVAILIAAMNARDTIGRAVRSALAQPQAQAVLLFDDGSTDDTADVARACDDGSGRLRIYASRTNLGPAAARNRLLEATQAPFVCVLDGDDYLRAGRLAAMAAAIGDADLYADDLLFAVEGEEDEVVGALSREGDVLPRTIDLAEFVTRCLNDPARPRRELAFVKPLVRRDFLARHHIAYDETLRLGEDYILYARCLAAGARFVLGPAAGYVAVERAGSLSGRHTPRDLRAFLAADRALLALPGMTPRVKAALHTHLRQLKRNADFRDMLDRKARGDLTGLAALMLSAPDSVGFAVAQTLRARLQR